MSNVSWRLKVMLAHAKLKGAWWRLYKIYNNQSQDCSCGCFDKGERSTNNIRFSFFSI